MVSALSECAYTRLMSRSLGQLIKIINDNQMNYVVDQLIEFLSGKEDELRDISGLGKHSALSGRIQRAHFMSALKTITSELPTDGKTTSKTVEKLTPRLLKQLSSVSSTYR
jgi:cullin-associated NEDD8-dissociated protein 1